MGFNKPLKGAGLLVTKDYREPSRADEAFLVTRGIPGMIRSTSKAMDSETDALKTFKNQLRKVSTQCNAIWPFINNLITQHKCKNWEIYRCFFFFFLNSSYLKEL